MKEPGGPQPPPRNIRPAGLTQAPARTLRRTPRRSQAKMVVPAAVVPGAGGSQLRRSDLGANIGPKQESEHSREETDSNQVRPSPVISMLTQSTRC